MLYMYIHTHISWWLWQNQHCDLAVFYLGELKARRVASAHSESNGGWIYLSEVVICRSRRTRSCFSSVREDARGLKKLNGGECFFSFLWFGLFVFTLEMDEVGFCLCQRGKGNRSPAGRWSAAILDPANQSACCCVIGRGLCCTPVETCKHIHTLNHTLVFVMIFYLNLKKHFSVHFTILCTFKVYGITLLVLLPFKAIYSMYLLLNLNMKILRGC